MSLDLIQQTALDEDVNLLNAVMAKEEFFALAEKRKRDSAGSGFLEWGKNRQTELAINQGINLYPSQPSRMNMGCENISHVSGISRTHAPIALVNGVRHVIKDARDPGYPVTINFPPAPDGTKTYDSATGAVVDFKKDVDPKYGDVAATHNEAVARAFEGWVKNGDFRNGSADWITYGKPQFNVTDGVASVIYNTTEGGTQQLEKYYITGFKGETVEMEVTIDEVVGGNIRLLMDSSEGTLASMIVSKPGTYTLKAAVPEKFQPKIRFSPNATSFKVSNITTRPVTNKVITTRKDLVFLETWHENLATNDLFNPLGNVQYGTGSFDGITGFSNNLVAQGYSAFGEWDTATKGYGKRWSTMTAVEKIKAIQNPDNNIYYDAETKKYIQVKYRIRVVEGLGDEWEVVRPSPRKATTALVYVATPFKEVQVQGSATAVPKGWGNGWIHNNGAFVYAKHSAITNNPAPEEETAFVAIKNKGFTHVAYQGLCFALPICLVQRLNQGAYHPIWNSEGCDGFNSTSSSPVFQPWYNSVIGNEQTHSTKDCFIIGRKHGLGVIGSTSGRPDRYKFYDAIYAGQVEDLRLNANKQDYNRLLEDGIRKAVAGKTRGKGKVPFLMPCKSGDKDGSPYKGIYSVNDFTSISPVIGSKVFCKRANGDFTVLAGVIERWEPGVIWMSENVIRTSDTYWVSMYLSPEYDSLPWVDIVGTPERIAATFPNGVVGQWLPTLNGEFFLNRKSTTGSLKSTYTTNNGISWFFNSNVTVDTVKNSHTNNTYPPEAVSLWSYETLSNFTAPANNSVVVGEVGDVYASSDHRNEQGNRMQNSVTNLVAKSNTGQREAFVDLTEHFKGVGQFLYGSSDYVKANKHINLPIAASTNNSPAVKTLYTLTSKDGLLYMQYHGNELKYKAPVSKSIVAGTAFTVKRGDIVKLSGFENWVFNNTVIQMTKDINNITWSAGALNTWSVQPNGDILEGNLTSNATMKVWDGSGWGDDRTIPVINGEGTKTNLNGEIVKTFCHHEMFPIGIADATESLPSTTRYINFYAMKYVPHSLVQHYDEVDCIKGYDTEIVDSICEFTGEPITTEVKVPIMGKELVRKPFYFEDNGHIDDAEIERHTQYVQAVDEYIEGLIEESESKTPQLMI